MKKMITIAAACLMSIATQHIYGLGLSEPNPPDTTETESMDEILVSAQRFDQQRKYSPRQIEVVTAKKLAELQPATLGDALINTGQVFVQKSQMGGSSPVLRGFEASRVLLVVDGIRMNNATYRAGHLQDIITIDPQILDRMEVNFGSGSTLFGSDAMGGVLYFKTKTPILGKKMVSPFAAVRVQSASKSIISNAGLSIQMPKWGLIASATQSNFGDLRSGSRNYSDIDTFGYRSWYVSRINNRDTLLRNEDPTKQLGTGYDQTDFFAKLLVKTGAFKHTINAQRSQSELIPRYDRLTEFETDNNGNLRPTFGRWDYAPQNRSLLSYQIEQGKEQHKQRLTLARQSAQVGRITRNFQSVTQRSQLDTVVMLTANYDRSDALSDRWKLNSGLEWVGNDVRSRGINTHIINGTESITKARYADSGARTSMSSVYSQLLGDLPKWKANVQAGVRATHYRLLANYSLANPWKLPFNSIEFSNNTLSFDVGVNKEIRSLGILKASVNQAFRNPNVDDMTKVFESKPGAKLLVPSPNLQAERSTTLDLGILINKVDRFVVEAGVYRSLISNLLLDQAGTLNGQDSVEFDGRWTPVFQLMNIAEGRISGIYTNAKFRIADGWWWTGSLNYTRGIYRNSLASDRWEPLDHIPPMYGQTSVKYTRKKHFAEIQYLFNGTKSANLYSSSGEDNQDKQPYGLEDRDGDGKADGYNPAWGIWTLRGGYSLPKGFSLQLAVENVLDLHYRYFASGMSASGRNVLVSVKWDLGLVR